MVDTHRIDDPEFTFMSGIESTYMPHADVDVLETTRHVENVEADIALAHKLNLRYLRYSAPWHRIEPERGKFNWKWMDRAMGRLQEWNIEPIIDLVHHTSFPKWIEGGFANPDFPQLLGRFSTAFAKRYPWVTWYTVFNEPYITCILCGSEGVWYPFYKDGDTSLIPMILNACKALCLGTREIQDAAPHARFMHVDTCEKHIPLDESARETTDFLNTRRFLCHDLVRGRVDDRHPLWKYLCKFGFDSEFADWFIANAARVDLLGLDYYAHSELGHHSKNGIQQPAPKPLGFAKVARDYQTRYRTPAVLSETNIRGTVEDRLSWMRHMLQQCDECAQEGRPLRGFGWYPMIDSCDWDSLLREPRGHVDPQGLYCLSQDRRFRHPSILTEWYARLAAGEATWQDLPAHPFTEDCLHWVRNHRDHLMSDWNWLENANSAKHSDDPQEAP